MSQNQLPQRAWYLVGFSGGSDGKASAYKAGDGLEVWVGKTPGGGHGYPLQNSCLENPTDRGAWGAMVHGVAKSETWLSTEQHRKHVLVERMPGSGSHSDLSGQSASRVSDLSSAVTPSHEHTHTKKEEILCRRNCLFVLSDEGHWRLFFSSLSN